MKYALVFIVGVAFGALLFVVGLAYNPFTGKAVLSPLAMTETPTLTLDYSAVASDAVLFTNNGESRISPHPDRVQQLWELPIQQTEASVTLLRNARQQVAGIGIKISSASEDTALFESKALRNSVWYVYLPGRGSLFIEQTDNYWGYLRDIVLPAYRSSSGTWKGVWSGVITSGPETPGTARVIGGSGEFAGLTAQAVETLSVKTWRDTTGPLAADGQLTIELPKNFASSR